MPEIQEAWDRIRCAAIIKKAKIKKSPQPQQGVRDERRNLYEDMVVDAESLGALQH